MALACARLFAVFVVFLGGGIVAAPHAGGAPPQPNLVVHSASYEGGWAVHDGVRHWVPAPCKALLEKRGHIFAVVPWSTIEAVPVGSAITSCDDLARSMLPEPPRLVVHSDNYEGGWLLVDGMKQWLDGSCRSQLEMVGLSFALEPWENWAALELDQRRTCGDIANIFGRNLVIPRPPTPEPDPTPDPVDPKAPLAEPAEEQVAAADPQPTPTASPAVPTPMPFAAQQPTVAGPDAAPEPTPLVVPPSGDPEGEGYTVGNGQIDPPGLVTAGGTDPGVDAVVADLTRPGPDRSETAGQ